MCSSLTPAVTILVVLMIRRILDCLQQVDFSSSGFPEYIVAFIENIKSHFLFHMGEEPALKLTQGLLLIVMA